MSNRRTAPPRKGASGATDAGPFAGEGAGAEDGAKLPVQPPQSG